MKQDLTQDSKSRQVHVERVSTVQIALLLFTSRYGLHLLCFSCSAFPSLNNDIAIHDSPSAMARSATRGSSFGYDKASPSPTSSLSSSPPTSYKTPRSRLPVRNRGTLTPGSGQSGSTATRVALTPIVNRNTPSPHPLPDDSLQVKLMSIYGRVEVPIMSSRS